LNVFEPVTQERRADRLIVWLLFTATFIALWLTERAVGYVRDESMYFEAARSYGGWFRALLERPGSALDDRLIAGHFTQNAEHPGLMKNLFALSHLVFHQKLQWLGPAVAYRLPAFAVAALIPPLVYRLGSGVYGRAAGLFAAVSFYLVPRQFFHAHLAAFDVPVAAFWLLTVYAFWRAQHRPGWWLWTGVAFGLGLATKHNTFFLPLVLAPFALWLGAKQSAKAPGGRPLFYGLVGLYLAVAFLYAFLLLILGPKAFLQRFLLLSPQTLLFVVLACGSAYLTWRARQVDLALFRTLGTITSLAVIGPLVLYAVWPYLWFHPVDRVAWWLNFHATHNHYAWFYLGDLLRAPPFPLAYVVVKTALTVPTSLFVPMALGALTVTLRLGAAWLPATARWVRPPGWVEYLVLANAVLSIAVITHPQVPHFGGVKHWFPSMPFLAILAGYAVVNATRAAGEALARSRAKLPAWSVALAVSALLCAPALVATWRSHPYGTSYYSELAGGLPGAASLGMQRQYWSNNVTGVLDWINQHAPPNARIWLHEVHPFSFPHYQQNGLLRPDLRMARGPTDADFAAYQYHQEFREHEFNIWEAFDTTRPVMGLYVDETPQVVVYQRRR
jgi:4-amino-4-deoxy-L-arabinose transferase-like glycosyltransferase